MSALPTWPACHTIWLGVLNYLETENYDISSLRRIPVGGSAAPRALIEAYEKKHGVEIVHAWGMTEMNPIDCLCYLKSHMHDWPEEENFPCAPIRYYRR